MAAYFDYKAVQNSIPFIYLFINDYEYLKRFVHSRLYDRLQSVNGH